MRRISISSDHGIWLGSCPVDGRGRISDCPMTLGGDEYLSEQLYKRMEELISEGRIRGRVDHYEYEVYNVVQ